MSARRGRKPPKVLFVGQNYYYTYYLSRELRGLGWRADVLHTAAEDRDVYVGSDFRFRYGGKRDTFRQLVLFSWFLLRYDVFHFSNARGLTFGPYVSEVFRRIASEGAEIRLLRRMGKKVVYSNNGCLDGVAQSSFAAWDDPPPCDDCVWRERPDVCSDERNLAWGRVRNETTDFQITIGANRADYNAASVVHEVPQFYCIDPSFWRPDIVIPEAHRLALDEDSVAVYHGVGSYDIRTQNGRNIKSSHLWLPIFDRLRAEGLPLVPVTVHDQPHASVRFAQAQSHVLVDMLRFGWFGANVIEGMMMGCAVVCYLRPSFRATIQRLVPGYVEELPVVSATPATAEQVLRDLLTNPDHIAELGRRGRSFAEKWHSPSAGARRLDSIYRALLAGKPRPDDMADPQRILGGG